MKEMEVMDPRMRQENPIIKEERRMTGKRGLNSWIYALKLGTYCIPKPKAQLLHGDEIFCLASLQVSFSLGRGQCYYFGFSLSMGFQFFRCFNSHRVLLKDNWSLFRFPYSINTYLRIFLFALLFIYLPGGSFQFFISEGIPASCIISSIRLSM